VANLIQQNAFLDAEKFLKEGKHLVFVTKNDKVTELTK
jgi:hypothetical protein